MTDQEYFAIQRSAQPELFKIPGVHAVAIGGKRVDGRPTNTVAIIVSVLKKLPLNEIPPDQRIPKEFQGVPTDVVEEAIPEPHKDTKEYRPLEGGCQIQIVKEVNPGGTKTSSGTLGCIVLDASDDTPYILTNDHVVSESMNLKVWQPDMGSISICCHDYCCGNDPVGSTKNTVHSTNVDAATVTIGDTKYKNDVLEIGTIQGTYDVTVNDVVGTGYPVKKRGKTTGLTSGNVTKLNQCGTRSDGWEYTGQSMVVPDTPPFSDHGDSGAVVMDSQCRVVGLNWGGSDSQSFFCPVADVMSQLSIKFMTGENQGGGSELSAREIHRRILAQLEGDAEGKELVHLFRRHFDEIFGLIRTHRPVTVAWHRQGGPKILQSFAGAVLEPDMPMPTVVDGYSIRHSMEQFEVVLLAHGSAPLRADILRYRNQIYGMIGLSFDQILSGIPGGR